MSKDMGKRLSQLYYIKLKISYDLGYITIVVYLSLRFSVVHVAVFFLRNRWKEYVPAIIESIVAKFKQILWERFGNILKQSFKNHKDSETASYAHN